MENGKVYVNSGTLYLYNHKISLGDEYKSTIQDLANYICSTKYLENGSVKSLVIELNETKIYGINCSTYLYFQDQKLFKIKLDLHLDIKSEISTEEYQSKLDQNARVFKSQVLQQYFSMYDSTVNQKDSTFKIKNNDYCFYTIFPKNGNNLICNAIIKSH